MNDTPSEFNIPLVEVIDYVEMGRIVAGWAKDPSTRPETVEEFKIQTDGVAVVPDRIKGLMFVQSSMETLVLRLPEENMMQMAEDFFGAAENSEQYHAPSFYRDQYEQGSGAELSKLEFLYARVGDYTIAQCR